MKCPRCEYIGKKSNVIGGVGTTTLVYYNPYYDEEGRYHHHDANKKVLSYSCSEGHKWHVESHGDCWCGWSGGKESIIFNKDEDEL